MVALGLCSPRGLSEGVCEILLRLLEVWLEAQGFAEFGDAFITLAGQEQRRAQFVMRFG